MPTVELYVLRPARDAGKEALPLSGEPVLAPCGVPPLLSEFEILQR